MSSLTQLISEQCCGALLGHSQKTSIIASIARLESEERRLNAEIKELEDELIEVREEALVSCKAIFILVYKGTNPEQAWLQLCAELGKEV